MNIWAWVSQARARLAAGDGRGQRLRELIDDLPTAAVNEAHERVDAMVPEALALARELDEPWLEVFIRHWSLQSRVLHRRRAGEELREAVALLDFASGPRTSGCPQSVCAVQDVAVCYAIRDGPGYVPERLAVARETLGRIDPSWACFDCINGEYVSALLDDQQPDQALAFIEAQRDVAAEHGELEPGFNSRLNRARALRELGRPAEALRELETIKRPERYGSSRLMSHRQARLAVLLQLGRGEEALALHPPLSAVIDTGAHLREWVDNLVSLIDAQLLPNGARAGYQLLQVQRRFEISDAYWDSARTALIAARLALDRGAREHARLYMNEAAPWLAKLRRGRALETRRDALVAELAAPPESPLRETAPASAADDPLAAAEMRLEQLARARAREPVEAVLERASTLRELGWTKRARALLERAVEELDDDDARARAVLELAAALLAEHDHDALDALVDRIGDDEASWLGLRWVRGQSLISRRELERALELDLDTLARAPAPVEFRLRLASCARRLGRWVDALDALELAATQLPPGEVDWDRITAATVLERWDRVRAAAARLGLDLPGEGEEPVSLDMGMIRCEFVEQNGSRERYWGLRTSPCAARVVEIAMPNAAQHYRDRVVFEPIDLDAHLRDSSQQRAPCYEVIEVLEPGRTRAFLLRGYDPGHHGVERLREHIRERGWGFERISAPGTKSPDPRQASEDTATPTAMTPTMALLVALGEHDPPLALRDLLTAHTKDWPLPLLCPALDRAVNDESSAEAAEAVLARWRP